MRSFALPLILALSSAPAFAQGLPGQINTTIYTDGHGTRLYIGSFPGDSSPHLIFETPGGVFVMGGNEMTIASKGDDPAKLRLTSPAGHNCLSFNKTVTPSPMDQIEMVQVCGSEAEDAPGSHGGQFLIGVTRKWTTGDAAMRRKMVISSAYTGGDEPFVWLYPSLGPFSEGIVSNVPPPPSSTPPPGTNCANSVPAGNFGALAACYGFTSGDVEYYNGGRMTWADVIAGMERRR